MSTMEQATSDLLSHIQSTSVPQPPQEVNFSHLAAQQVSQVQGLDPSQTQLATFLATPRCEIRVAKECQNRPNLKVFFKASKWLDMLRTSMTTIASTFVLQKNSFFHFFADF